jgi:hypothetical protein
MNTFAVVANGFVENIIVADSLQIAEEVTGKLCVQIEGLVPAEIGGTWDGTRFVARKPHGSWVLNDSFEWEAPVPMPTDGKEYEWNEDTQSWVIV